MGGASITGGASIMGGPSIMGGANVMGGVNMGGGDMGGRTMRGGGIGGGNVRGGYVAPPLQSEPHPYPYCPYLFFCPYTKRQTYRMSRPYPYGAGGSNYGGRY